MGLLRRAPFTRECSLRVKRRHRPASGSRLVWPPRADIDRPQRHVRFVPTSDIGDGLALALHLRQQKPQLKEKITCSGLSLRRLPETRTSSSGVSLSWIPRQLFPVPLDARTQSEFVKSAMNPMSGSGRCVSKISLKPLVDSRTFRTVWRFQMAATKSKTNFFRRCLETSSTHYGPISSMSSWRSER
jgi:hypothetical protein